MSTVVIMPKQGQSVESCILTEVKKKKGDSVAVGDVLFSYETDKASFEEVAQTAGTVLDVFFSEGDEIPVLTNVMVIGNPGESFDEFRPFGEITAETATKEIGVTVIGLQEQGTPVNELATPTQASSGATSPVSPRTNDTFGGAMAFESGITSPVSPRARTLADKNAIQAETLAGTGPDGRVIERDVQAVISATPKTTSPVKAILKATGAPLPDRGTGLAGTVKAIDMNLKSPDNLAGHTAELSTDKSQRASVVNAGLNVPLTDTSDSVIKPLTNMRKLIAKAMYTSLQNSAQLTHHLGADARNILSLRKSIKQSLSCGFPTDVTINDFVCFAVIRALKKFPNVNAHLIGDNMRLFQKVHLAIAVDTERGLMVPTVRNADELCLTDLAIQLKAIANACKKGGITPDLLSPEAASFTVSNLGNYGVEMFTPVINLPQVAILGVNTIVPRPKEISNGLYGFVPYIGLSLTYDHRAIDGGEATRFLKQVANEIEDPEFKI